MMLCLVNFRVLFSFIVLSLVAVAAAEKTGFVKNGGLCRSDSDCVGNLDCTSVGFFKRRCFAVSCAKGAGMALLEYGFDPDQYIATLKDDMGVSGDRQLINDNTGLRQALALHPPPMAVFNANYSACLNPESDPATRHLQFESTWYGLQWSGAAAFSYFGKSTWYDARFFDYQLVSNCVGILLGADVGIDVLFQVYTDRNFLPTLPTSFEQKASNDTSTQSDPGNTNFVPVIIAGPVGIQVGWFEDDGPEDLTITEITFGPSFGAALGGFNWCFNDLDTEFGR